MKKVRYMPETKKEPLRLVELVEVIHAKVLCGSGTDDDPFYIVDQYWGKDGRLLAEGAKKTI